MILKCLVQILITYHVAAYDNRVITTLKYSRHYMQPVVVNGEPASLGQVPYMVSIKQKGQRLNINDAIWNSLCGGTILAPTKVLTAAHCFESKNYNLESNREKLRTVAGVLKADLNHDTITDSDGITQWRHIDSIVSHRDYHFPIYDIALVFVNARFQYNDNVAPISYAHSNTDYVSWCTASGFGETVHWKGNSMSPRLLIARIFVLSRRECSTIWEMNMDQFLCTRSAYSDVARGDSGGPLVCKGTLEKWRESPRGILVGVVAGKNFDKTTLFTRVSTYKDWIERNRGFGVRSNVLSVVITIFLV